MSKEDTQKNLAVLTDTKKLQSRIKKLTDMIATGGKAGDDALGSNDVLKRVFQALKGQPKTPLDKVNIGHFGEGDYGYLRADNYIIGKSGDEFFLFKAKERKSLSEEDKKRLEKNIVTFSKNLKGKTEIEKFLDEVKFAEAKPLSKSDIVETLFQEAKGDEELKAKVSKYMGIEKPTKDHFKDLSFGDIGYMIHNNEEGYRGTQIAKVAGAYEFLESTTEIRLARNANVKQIASPELQKYNKKIDNAEAFVYEALFMLAEESKKPTSPEKGRKISQITLDLLKTRGELGVISKELEKGVFSHEEMINIIKAVKDSDEVYLVGKESIALNNKATVEEMKIGLKRTNEVVDYFENEGVAIAKELEIELVAEVEVTNYGVFADLKPENALANLVLYAKSMNEMVFDDKREIEKLQEYDGNFAI